ncbi:unnamed protein product [Brassica rapa]|uniref:DUF4283 domain-containing protein n=2 Tax=Brassica campestris TaxID=3711 RepID=A0A8D9DCU7_BRACM|nr:unnamed protein product [Brassica rapa]
MKFRNKQRHPLQGSSKMARFAAAAKGKKKSIPLASNPIADAVIATGVVEEKLSSSYEAVTAATDLTQDESALALNVKGSASLSVEGTSTHERNGDLQSVAAPVIVAETSAHTDTVLNAAKEVAFGSSPVHLTADTPSEETETVRPVSPSGNQNYASLLKASAKLEELGTPTEHVSGAPFVLIPDDNIQSAREEFKDFLFARFHSDFPSMGRIIGVVNAIWAKAGPRIFVHNIGQGCYLLRVINIKARESLLSRTCWNVAGYPMFVAPWSPDFAPEEAPLTSAVVPVELRNVPYLLFNQQSLSRIATAIGKPDSLAPETERKENFKVAKMYVRVDLTKPLPSKIISGFSNGREVEISVTYPWLPVKCSQCGRFGHENDKCRVPAVGGRTVVNRDRSTSRSREKKPIQERAGRSRPNNRRHSRKPVHNVKISPEKDRDPAAIDREEGEISLGTAETSIDPTGTAEVAVAAEDAAEGVAVEDAVHPPENGCTRQSTNDKVSLNYNTTKESSSDVIHERRVEEHRSGYSQTDHDATSDDGFLLVLGRKSRRKAKRNH